MYSAAVPVRFFKCTKLPRHRNGNVHGRGTGADCRKHVQKLNSVRGEISELNDAKEISKCSSGSTSKDFESESSSGSGGEVALAASKWNNFIEHSEEQLVELETNNTDIDALHFTTDWAEYQRGTKRQREISRRPEWKQSNHVNQIESCDAKFGRTSYTSSHCHWYTPVGNDEQSDVVYKGIDKRMLTSRPTKQYKVDDSSFTSRRDKCYGTADNAYDSKDGGFTDGKKLNEVPVRFHLSEHRNEQRVGGSNSEQRASGLNYEQRFSGFNNEQKIGGFNNEQRVCGFNNEQGVGGFNNGQKVGFSNEQIADTTISSCDSSSTIIQSGVRSPSELKESNFVNSKPCSESVNSSTCFEAKNRNQGHLTKTTANKNRLSNSNNVTTSSTSKWGKFLEEDEDSGDVDTGSEDGFDNFIM